MENKQDSATITKQINELEDEKQSLQKKKRLWEEYKEHWAYLQREEQELLGEVAYISEGTISANHANQQLTYFEEEVRDTSRLLDDIEEGFEQKEKGLYDKEDQLNEAYFEAKKQEEEPDDEI